MVILGGTVSESSSATTQECQQAVQQAEQACNAAEQARNAGDASQSAQTGAGAGNDINANCQKIGNDIAKQMGRINQAKQACENAKNKCNSQCEAAKNSPDPGDLQPGFPQTKSSVSAKQKECTSKIQPRIDNANQALQGLGGNSGQADACKQASDKGGQPPQPPQLPQNQDDKKEAEKKETVKCDSTEGIRYSDCNNHYLKKCTGAIQTAGCEDFAVRYCGAASPGKQADVVIDNQTNVKAASVVVDKGGEGLGSGFCNMYSAYKFCKNGARESCPSCQGTHAWDTPACQSNASLCKPVLSDSQLLNAKESCPTDPVFLDPAVQKQVVAAEEAKKNETGGATTKPPTQPGGGTAAGGPAGGGNTPAGGGADKGFIPESAGSGESRPVGTSVPVDSGGGGGGGGYGVSSVSEEEDAEEGKPRELSSESVLPAGAVEGMAPDVSNQFGPNVFSISTAVYRQMCSTHRLTGCRPRRR